MISDHTSWLFLTSGARVHATLKSNYFLPLYLNLTESNWNVCQNSCLKCSIEIAPPATSNATARTSSPSGATSGPSRPPCRRTGARGRGGDREDRRDAVGGVVAEVQEGVAASGIALRIGKIITLSDFRLKQLRVHNSYHNSIACCKYHIDIIMGRGCIELTSAARGGQNSTLDHATLTPIKLKCLLFCFNLTCSTF